MVDVRECCKALHRDVNRYLGNETYIVGTLRLQNGVDLPNFAETTHPTPCEECGVAGRYFHLVRDDVTYPLVFERNRLVCHDCFTSVQGGLTAVPNVQGGEIADDGGLVFETPDPRDVMKGEVVTL